MNRLVVVLAAALLAASVAGAAWIDPNVAERMDADDGALIDVYVVMNEQLDLGKVTASVTARGGNRADRHYEVVTRLQDLAQQTQGAILAQTTAAADTGEVTKVRPFWIANSLAITARPSYIRRLAERPDVSAIYLDYKIKLIEPVDVQPEPAAGAIASVENGIADTNAPDLWAMGIDGTGALACDQDTGADGSHPAFADRWRGLDSGVSPDEAWFDPVSGQTFPTDSYDHGTHTLGTMVGSDGTNQIGMAPGAKWIGAKTVDAPGTDIFSDAVAAFQWMTDPDGDPATVDDVPDVVNNSWGLDQGYYGSCRTDFNTGIQAAEAAGVVVVFSAGNSGSGSQTIGSPANQVLSDLTVFSVGALNQDGSTIAYFSSRGPSDCDGSTIKPEVSAIGVDVRSSVPGGGYGTMSGTSMSGPHVSGAVLLLRQAFPDATADEIKLALYDTAVDLGSTGEDNTYGKGKIDVLAAYWFLDDYLQDSDGRVEIGALYSCDDTITITVNDADLTGPTVDVTIQSPTDAETVTLAATGSTGEYEGVIDTAASGSVGDGVLRVANGNTITVHYIDADDGNGGHNVDKTDTAVADCAAPTFAGLSAAVAGDHEVTLTWSAASDPHGVSYNVYRAETAGGQDFGAPVATVETSPYVDDAANGVTYYYVVRAADDVGNEDSNTVERSATPIGPNLIWQETWESVAAYDHEWEIVDGGPDGATWMSTNPGDREPENVSGTFMIVDSDFWNGYDMDESLVSEVIDVSGYVNVFLRYGHEFVHYEQETGDVDVSLDGGDWVTVASYSGADTAGVVDVDLSTYDFTTLQVRFHYYDANYEWWWAVDDIQVWGWETGGDTITCYADTDADTYGDPDVSDEFDDDACPSGWSANNFDCDDTDDGVHPGADDSACDGIDDNCNGQTDEGYESYTCGLGICVEDSTCASGDEQCVPGTPETEDCSDGLDNDCDGDVDIDDSDCADVCPRASFNYTTDDLTATFTDGSSDDLGLVSWTWDFGDGSTSGAQNPSHTYDADGTYTVCLEVENQVGCTDEVCVDVSVEEEADPDPGCGTTSPVGGLLPPLLVIAALLGLAVRRREA